MVCVRVPQHPISEVRPAVTIRRELAEVSSVQKEGSSPVVDTLLVTHRAASASTPRGAHEASSGGAVYRGVRGEGEWKGRREKGGGGLYQGLGAVMKVKVE